MGFLVRVIINGAAIWFAAALLPGINTHGVTGTAETLVLFGIVGLVFGLVNAVVKPIVALLSLPMYILTLGLFTLVVNGAMLVLTSWIAQAIGFGLTIKSFGSAVLGAIVVSIVSVILSAIASKGKKD